MSEKVNLRKITVQAAEALFKKGESRLFVKNRTGTKGTDFEHSGNINFTISYDGQPVTVISPVTWLPFDLSIYAPADVILRNPNFRRVVSRGLIDLINPEDADAFIAQSGEKGRVALAKLLNAVRSDEEGSNESSLSQQINPTAPNVDDKVGIFAQNIVVRAESENIDDLIAELDDKEGSLSDDELRYIVDNATNADLKAWAALAIDERK